MDLSSLALNTLRDSQNLPVNPSHSLQERPLSMTSLQQASQDTQENTTPGQKEHVLGMKGMKAERRQKLRENEDSENRQDQNIVEPPSTEKVLKEKKMLLNHGQITKKSPMIRTNGILTERQLNVNLETQSSRGSVSSRSSDEDRLSNSFYSKDQNSKNRDENSILLVPKKDPLAIAMNMKRLQKYTVKQLLHVSKSKINFGSNMPGQIIEESLDIVNKTNQNLVVQINLDSDNHEFQDTEDYVYSIRRSHLYDFNDKHYLIMAAFSSASFKVTLKVPNVKKECDNNGFIDISVQGLKESSKIVLESKIKVPKIVCPKALYHQSAKLNIIKLAAREGKKHEYKLPFKNEGDTPVTIEFSFHDAGEAYKGEKVDCSVYPQTLTLQPNSSTLVMFSFKVGQINSKYRKDGSHKEKGVCAKKVLLGKIKDTNLIYSYYFCIETY